MLGFAIMLVNMNTVADRSGRISMDDLSEPTCRACLSAGKLAPINIRTNLPGVRHIRQVGSDDSLVTFPNQFDSHRRVVSMLLNQIVQLETG